MTATIEVVIFFSIPSNPSVRYDIRLTLERLPSRSRDRPTPRLTRSSVDERDRSRKK